MNRLAFILALFVLLIGGYYLLLFEVRGYALIILIGGTLVTTFRRKNLNMTPWLGGTLRDIATYFKKP